MSQDIGTSHSSGRPAALLGSPDLPPGRPDTDRATGDLAAALRGHKATFARALAHQEDDFLRFCDERREQTRRSLAALGRCACWADLIGLQEDWARIESEASLIEARRLILHAGLIRHPDWLTRQVRAAHRLAR
jgi:hypothetical protein